MNAQAPAPLPFVDLAAQRRRLGGRADAAVSRVLEHGQYILGPEVRAFEAALAAHCGAKHAVGVASGADALLIALLAAGVGPGDAVICPSFTFCATAEMAALLGATPVFVDVREDDFNLDPAQLPAALALARSQGLQPKAIVAVDLFGLAADYDAIDAFAEAEGLLVIADAAQSYGADFRGRKVGRLAPVTTTSFFPAKPLGCWGDGGAILTDDDAYAELARSLRAHGAGSDRYDNVRIGITGRLDTIQAAILIEKLAIFDEEIVARRAAAAAYSAALADAAAVPATFADRGSVWAQYTLRLPKGRRAAVAERLKAAGVPTAIYYPIPLHRQVAYRGYPVVGNGLPVSDRLADEVLSLPMHAYLSGEAIARVVGALRAALA
ncbi:MAG: DegT/DnrJ/EryC1/StrS aminotransferase family protein [Hyphomicrobiales bacterium]|nr:DegT/DnrJ/EryC1/StrS aminotransferase family protein [Hyphomicrobiales bacterium]